MTSQEQRAIRGVVAFIWVITGALSFGIYPVEDSLVMLQGLPVPYDMLIVVLYGAAALDIVMGILTVLRPCRRLWVFQAGLIISYSMLATWLVPQFWLHPFGPLLKNIAILALLWLLYLHDGARSSAR